MSTDVGLDESSIKWLLLHLLVKTCTLESDGCHRFGRETLENPTVCVMPWLWKATLNFTNRHFSISWAGGLQAAAEQQDDWIFARRWVQINPSCFCGGVLLLSHASNNRMEQTTQNKYGRLLCYTWKVGGQVGNASKSFVGIFRIELRTGVYTVGAADLWPLTRVGPINWFFILLFKEITLLVNFKTIYYVTNRHQSRNVSTR